MHNSNQIHDLFNSETYKSTDTISQKGSVPFVGFKVARQNNEKPISLPYGFSLSKDTKDLANDFNLLLDVLEDYFKFKENAITNKMKNIIDPFSIQNLTEYANLVPIRAYEVILRYYLNNNRKYYFERKPNYKKAPIGKIDWAKTIKKIKPIFNNNSPMYLEYITRTNTPNLDNMITKINIYCVEQAINWLGAKFGISTVNDNKIIFNKDLFNFVLNEKLNNTNNDEDKLLFKAMIALINNRDEVGITNECYGTYFFNEVFEYMIDKMFNTEEKQDFYPGASYYINNIELQPKLNDSIITLKPDTIIKEHNFYYVIDAKYYKFPFTTLEKDLPSVSDINKQFSYAKYVKKKTKKLVYNAFLLPFNKDKFILPNYEEDKEQKTNQWCLNVGEATAPWNDNEHNLTYERIQIIYIDMKYLMQNYKKNDGNNRKILCQEIRNGYQKTKN